MKKYLRIRYLIVFTLLFHLSSCGGDDGPSDPPDIPDGPRTAQDVVADFKELDIKVGINDLELESLVEGVYWKFRLIVPAGATAENKRPLVLRLHGGALNFNPGAHKSTDCLVEPAFEGKDVFILSPNSDGVLWYSQPNILQVLALIDLTASNFDVDLDRVAVTGFSDGGNGSWFYAQYYASIFSASIPLASSYNTENSEGVINKIDVPLYVIHGEDDDLFPVDATLGYIQDSEAAGSDITFELATGLGHYEPCEYIDEMKNAVEWLETEVW